MKISVFAYSRQGIRIAERLLPLTEEDKKQFFAPERIAGGHFSPIPMPSKKSGRSRRTSGASKAIRRSSASMKEDSM